MYMALARPPPGYVMRVHAVPLFRDTYRASPPIAMVSPPAALHSNGG